MNIIYEKHQRDYTLLACSEVVEEFLGHRMEEFFFYRVHPIYVLIDNGILYHFIAAEDYSGWPLSYIKKHSYAHLQEYETELNKELANYRKFLDMEHEDTAGDILRLHQYMRLFLPIIIVSAYVPIYCKDAGKCIIDVCLRIRKEYDDVHKVGMSLQESLLNRLEKELEIKYDSLKYLTSREFKNFLTSRELPENLEERKSFVLIENSHNGEKIFSKDESFAKMREIDVSKKLLNVQKIKGNVAFKGVVSGKVKLIRLIEDAKKIEDGDILVTSMTDPRYISAMKKAAAFITDEGGITCHAAIVARELKKPCIIGTKIATQVLHDGDLVEIDAENGIVRIIEKKI